MRHYGWIPSRPDWRDVLYQYAPPQTLALPPRVDLTEGWDSEPFDPVWQQGSLGSCGPQTAAADIVFAILRQQKGANSPMPSRLFIYWHTRYVMGTLNSDSGVTNRDLLKSLARYGWCDESAWPYDIAKYKVEPPLEAKNEALKWRIDKYHAVPQDLTTLKACLAGGDPFILGFSVYSSIESASVQRSGNIPRPSRGDRQVGGHDVLCVGYDDSTTSFKIRNSWGREWGKDGYGTLPYSYVTDRNLAGDFWTITHGGYAPPAPEPSPVENVIVVKPGQVLVVKGVA